MTSELAWKYDFFISAAGASLLTPSTLYGSLAEYELLDA